MKFSSIKQLTYTALLAAMVLVTTMVVSVPVPGTGGYIHFGDAAIFLAGALLGPVGGALAAGIGSMLADILTGYAHWALPTLIIKSLMGLTVGYLMLPGKGFPKLREALAMLLSGLLMVAGYYVASAWMKGNWIVPLASIPMNILQFAVGMAIALVVLSGVHKTQKTRALR